MTAALSAASVTLSTRSSHRCSRSGRATIRAVNGPSELPPNDVPGRGLVPAEAGAAAADAGEPLTAPGGTAAIFLLALEDRQANFMALRNLTTPESWAAWGDFGGAAAALADIPGWAVGTRGEPAVGDPEIRYLAVLSGIDAAQRSDGDTLVNARSILTVVRRPSLGGWLVHAMGPAYVLPEDVPHDPS
jgi:hypothetical protein